MVRGVIYLNPKPHKAGYDSRFGIYRLSSITSKVDSKRG